MAGGCWPTAGCGVDGQYNERGVVTLPLRGTSGSCEDERGDRSGGCVTCATSAGIRRSVWIRDTPSAADTAVGSEAGTAVGTAATGRSSAGEGSPGAVEQAAGAGEDAEVVQVSIARISLLMALSAGAQASVAHAGSSMLGSGDGAPVSCKERQSSCSRRDGRALLAIGRRPVGPNPSCAPEPPTW